MIIDLYTGVAKLVGPRTVSAVVTPSRRTAGFALSGSGLARIVGGDADQLIDTAIDLSDLGSDLPRLPDQLDNTALRAFAFHLVERFEVDDCIVVAEQLIRSGVPASSVPSLLGLERRKFVPAFRELVGVAPKRYEMLGRLQRANSVLRSQARVPLATIAADLGFADRRS